MYKINDVLNTIVHCFIMMEYKDDGILILLNVKRSTEGLVTKTFKEN